MICTVKYRTFYVGRINFRESNFCVELGIFIWTECQGVFFLTSYVDLVRVWGFELFEDGEDVNLTVVRGSLFTMKKVSNIGRNTYFVQSFLVIPMVVSVLLYDVVLDDFYDSESWELFWCL